MERLDHLGPSLLHNFFLSPWSVSLNGHSVNKGTKIGQISDFQHAYSGSKGTDTALSTLVNLIESAILRKQGPHWL